MKADLKFKLKAPVSDRLIVRVLETEKVSAGGIIIPDNVRSDHAASMVEALVLHVGETADMELDVFPEAGDYVLITKYGGTMYKESDGSECRVIRGDDILATLEIDNG